MHWKLFSFHGISLEHNYKILSNIGRGQEGWWAKNTYLLNMCACIWPVFLGEKNYLLTWLHKNFHFFLEVPQKNSIWRLNVRNFFRTCPWLTCYMCITVWFQKIMFIMCPHCIWFLKEFCIFIIISQQSISEYRCNQNTIRILFLMIQVHKYFFPSQTLIKTNLLISDNLQETKQVCNMRYTLWWNYIYRH